MKTSELLTEWLCTHEKERVKPRTYSRYEGVIELHISPAIGDMDISAISGRDIHSFLNLKKQSGNIKKDGFPLSPSSTNLMLTVLNLAFEYACDMEMITTNPCARIHRSPEKKQENRGIYKR